jgi:F-type H+-transporting ATPase subunit b
MKIRLKGERRVWLLSSWFFFFFCVALSAHAAEENGNAGAQAADHIFKWINFAIVIGIMVWLFGKKLRGWFRSNAESISSAITKATAAKEAAEREVREAQGKLVRLQQEVDALRSAAKHESEAEAERIRALAQSDARKVGIAAQAEIEAAERAARLELKAIAASLAVDGAESLLAKQLTPAAQETLVDSFVKSLEGRPN